MICPVCNELDLVLPCGDKDSALLIFGPYPGEEEIEKGTPWIGRAGGVLRWELRRAGISFATCRVTNLWLHEHITKPPKTRPNPLYKPELNWHFNQLKKEARGKVGILAMGALVSKMFFGRSIDNIAGCVVESEHLPDAEFIVASYNPATIFHSTVGEIRLAVKRFSDEAKLRGLI